MARLAFRRKILDALDQMHFCKNKVSNPIGKAILSGAYIAKRQYGWNLDEVMVHNCEVQRKNIEHRMRVRFKGRFGIIDKYHIQVVARIRKVQPENLDRDYNFRRLVDTNRKGIMAPVNY